jgi:hypothetical protein
MNSPNPFTALHESIKELAPKVAQEVVDLFPGVEREHMVQLQDAMAAMNQRLENPLAPIMGAAKQNSANAADKLVGAGGRLCDLLESTGQCDDADNRDAGRWRAAIAGMRDSLAQIKLEREREEAETREEARTEQFFNSPKNGAHNQEIKFNSPC